MFKRKLGRSGIEVSALGLGCWSIGGPAAREGRPVGWGKVDDAESMRAIRRALDLGITFFDTADSYGAGHSERILGKALGTRRKDVVIATKFGNVFNEEKRELSGSCAEPDYVRKACEGSLRRLDTDLIDLYQLHIGGLDTAQAEGVREVLEDLVSKGKIRFYGWSTDDPERARLFAKGPHCTAIQQAMSIFHGNADTLAVCEDLNLASINRSPLIKGVLTGKFNRDTTFPPDDVRHTWTFREGEAAERLEQIDKLRGVLTSGGHTLAQAALAWLWARSEKTIPIPGFKTVAQVEENGGALKLGPLSAEQMTEIERILER